MKKAVLFIHSITILLILILTSCPATFNAEQLAILQDIQSPVITITSPGEYSEYATVVNLTCTIDTNEAEKADLTEDFTVVYEIPGTTLEGSLTKQEDESFAATIDVSTLDGSHTIKITATDINGNSASSTINIVKPAGGGDISGFKVTPSNGKVTITWDDVPLAESYTLTEFNFKETKTNVTSPYEWDGLENGTVYSFQLIANIPEDTGSDAYSATIKDLPLSSRTFAPHISATDYKSITLEWWEDTNIPAEYSIERSTSPDGPWILQRSLTGHEFTDTKVEHNTEYWYRVYLANYTSITSSMQSAIPARFIPFDEKEPTLTSTGGYGKAVAVSGSYAYIGDIKYLGVSENKYMGLVIADISDPDNPVILGSAPTDGMPLGVAVSGNYAYIAQGTHGLVIIDITSKSDPVVTGSYDTAGSAYDVAISGDYAYVADGSDGLIVMDISNPSSPVYKGSFDTAGSTQGVTVSGNYAYIADNSNGLVILNISTPSAPYSETSGYTGYDTDSNGVTALDITLSGNSAFIADSAEGLVIIDISTVTSPTKTGAIIGTISSVKKVTVGNNFAYLADGSNGMVIVDISDQSTPSVFQTINGYSNPQVNAVASLGSHVYIADETKGLVTVDVATPAHAAVVNSVTSIYHSGGIDVAGDYAYSVNKDTGELSVISIETPSSPSKISTVDARDVALRVKVAGNYAFVANDNYGMTIYDISTPSSPSPLGSTFVSGNTDPIKDIAISGSYAYGAAGDNGLVIFDISDPANPTIKGSTNSGGSEKGITVSGNYAFAASTSGSNGELDIFNISNPSQPSKTASITDGLSSCSPNDVAVSGAYAYIAAGTKGLVAYNVSDPSNPGTSAAGSYDTGGEAKALAVSGKYAYIADDTNGLVIIDISMPSAPDIVTTVPMPNGAPALDVSIRGLNAYVAYDDFNGGVAVIKLWEDM